MEDNKHKKLLIIGCGRSGTLYSAEVWRIECTTSATTND